MGGIVCEFSRNESANQPVRQREWHALLISFPLQTKTAPATAVPVTAGGREAYNVALYQGTDRH